MAKNITEKDALIWQLLADHNFTVSACGKVFTRLARRARTRTTNHWREIGWVSESRNGTKNYMRLKYKGAQLYIHRIVWAACTGYLCQQRTINHKDLNGLNNHIENLELVTARENLCHARAIYKRQGLSATEAKANWIKGSGGGRNWRGKSA